MYRPLILAFTTTLCASALGACTDPASGPHDWLDDSDDGDTADEVDGTYDPYDQSPPLPPFSRPFEALVHNEAQWSRVQVTLVAAHVERGMDKVWTDDVTYPTIDPRDSYAELDIMLTNLTPMDEELSARQTWDLVLADGTRIDQENTLAASLAPLGMAQYTLRYAVNDDFDFTGAQLELNGAERGQLHPERIPLDGPYRPDIDVRLTELEGLIFEASDPEAENRSRVEIRSARVSRNSLVEGRAEYGQVHLALETDITAIASVIGTFIDEDDFRIDIDGKSTTAINDLYTVIGEGSTTSVSVVFAFGDDVRVVTLRLNVGGSGDNEEWQTVTVSFAPQS